MLSITSWRKQHMKKLEASRQATSALDKSREAVIVRVKALFDEADRQFDGREARQLREARRAELVFPDPETVGFNLPEHLVGDSADYRTEERPHGVNKDGFTRAEVRHNNTHTAKTSENSQHHTLAFALATNLPATLSLTLPLFPLLFPLSSFCLVVDQSVVQARAQDRRDVLRVCAHEALYTALCSRAWNHAKTRKDREL